MDKKLNEEISRIKFLIKESDIIFVFSDTPINLEGSYDTTKIFDATTNFFTLSSQDVELYEKRLVICSTTNPGEVEQIQTRLNMFNVQVAYNPIITEIGNVVKGITFSLPKLFVYFTS